MCLVNSSNILKRLMNPRFRSTIVGYKVLYLNETRHLYSLMYAKKPWRAGFVKSDSRRKTIAKDGHVVANGIHVFRKLADAKRLCREENNVNYRSGRNVVVKVYIARSDLFGANNYHLVARRVYLSENEYNKAIK